jgi:phosphoglycerate dehydrogenase-like enzyme
MTDAATTPTAASPTTALPATETTTTTRVAVLDDYSRRSHTFADWDSLGTAVEIAYFHEPLTEEELPAALGEFHILVLMRERTPFPRRVLEQLPNLRLVITTGMGNAAVDTDHLRQQSIPMVGTESYAGACRGVGTTIELAWAHIFATTKRITIEDRAVRNGAWQQGFPIGLAGKTLGLAGLGRLGAQMVGPARAFGLDVIAWSSNLTQERADEVGVERVSKQDLLARSDIVSIHLVLSDRSRGTFGADDLAFMKPTAVLINTSRGPIVEESALVAALKTGRIAAAGLDVFDTEPLPADHPLRTMERAVLTPHLGYVTEAGFRTAYAQVVEDIAAFVAGSPIRVIS